MSSLLLLLFFKENNFDTWQLSYHMTRGTLIRWLIYHHSFRNISRIIFVIPPFLKTNNCVKYLSIITIKEKVLVPYKRKENITL